MFLVAGLILAFMAKAVGFNPLQSGQVFLIVSGAMINRVRKLGFNPLQSGQVFLIRSKGLNLNRNNQVSIPYNRVKCF